MQELVLGIGGWRLLRALGIRPEVCHLNEGHAAFAVLERARSYMQDSGLSFEEALTITRAGNVFTTHTAVDAGFDRFAPDLIRQFLSGYAQHELRIMRSAGRRALVDYARERLARQEAGYGPERVQEASAVLDSEILTLGFARRFATYKRPTLLLHDRERLARILTNPERPVQLVIAGKAHPQDEPGRALIHEWTSFSRQPKLRDHVVFLADYDMLLAERLVEGVDVWINTPRRPWEASGTSGMKVLVNGGLNLSELDGWWAEAYTPEVGWALGDGLEHGDDPAWDAVEADALYDLLEREVIPEFYTRDQRGIPTAWRSE